MNLGSFWGGFGGILGHFGDSLRPYRVNGVNFGLNLGHFGQFGVRFGAFGDIEGHLGAF